jgi:hypothetical protein
VSVDEPALVAQWKEREGAVVKRPPLLVKLSSSLIKPGPSIVLDNHAKIERMYDNSTRMGEEALYGVRVCRLADGERLPLVVRTNGLPIPLPNQWSLYIRRFQVQSNTLTDELRTVAHVYDWAERRRIVLDERLGSGNGLQPSEIVALYQNLRYSLPAGRENASKGLADVREVDTIGGRVHANRVAVAKNFLTWAMEETLHRVDVGDPRATRVRERCEQLRRQAIEFQRPTSDVQTKRIGFDAQQRLRLLEIVSPEFAGNPSKGEHASGTT